MTMDYSQQAAPQWYSGPAANSDGITKTAKAVGGILAAVAWIAGGIILLAAVVSLLGGLFNGGVEGALMGLLIAVVATVVAAITWAQLMLFALVAKYIAVRTT